MHLIWNVSTAIGPVNQSQFSSQVYQNLLIQDILRRHLHVQKNHTVGGTFKIFMPFQFYIPQQHLMQCAQSPFRSEVTRMFIATNWSSLSSIRTIISTWATLVHAPYVLSSTWYVKIELIKACYILYMYVKKVKSIEWTTQQTIWKDKCSNRLVDLMWWHALTLIFHSWLIRYLHMVAQVTPIP
jgi:hypothetical protein